MASTTGAPFSKLRGALKQFDADQKCLAQKIGCGSALEARHIQRRAEIRMWSCDDVRRNLNDSLHNLTVLVPGRTGESKLIRISLPDALFRQKVDGNALLDLTEEDIMKWIGVCEVGIAKSLIRTVESLTLKFDDHTRPVSAPVSRKKITYASLDPFEGWDAPVLLHPKRNNMFRVKVIPKHAVSTTGAIASTQTQENAQYPLIERKDACTLNSTEDRPLEVVSAVETNYRIGLLEKERRSVESKTMFDTLRSAQTTPITLGWLIDSVVACFSIDSTAVIGLTKTCYNGVVSVRNDRSVKCIRPWSAGKIQREAVALPLPQESSIPSARAVVLSRNDFKAVVSTICDNRQPCEFDQLFRFLSAQFGAEHLEKIRRVRVLQSLFTGLAGNALLDSDAFDELMHAAEGDSSQRRKRPSSAPVQRSLETTGYSIQRFCEAFVESLQNLKPDEFDQRLQNVRVVAERKHQIKRGFRKQLICEADVEKVVVEKCSAAKPLVMLLSSTFNPTSLIERMFLNRKEAVESESRRRVAPALRQRHLLVFGVESEESIVAALESVQTSGIERGYWILVDCAKSASGDKTPLNSLLRRLSCMISCRPTNSINPSFRLFVRCPVDTVDLHAIPQIAQSVGEVVPLLS